MADEFDKPYCTLCESRLQSVFKSLDDFSLDALSSARACNVYKKGQIIFEEGTTPAGLYCMHSGKAKVFKTGEEGRDQIVRFVKGGDIMGYRALISGELYSGSASALEECLICFIPKETVFDMLTKDGRFSMQVIQLLSGELRKAEEQIVNLAQKPVRERLAETLVILKKIYGTEDGDTSPLNIKLSRDELASVVGTATETLVRTIADLKREALIATEKKKIRILDMDGLIRAGNLQD
jgi:CRP/FNR family transcriptional regulator